MSESQPENNSRNPEALLSHEEALDFLEHTVHNINFGEDLTLFGGHAQVATQVAHWTLETFGQQARDGAYSLYPCRDSRRGIYGEIPGSELPENMKQLVVSEFKGELHYGAGNEIKMTTSNFYIENEPEIPRRAEIEAFDTAREAIEFIRDNPEIQAGYKPPVVEVVPGARIEFSHYYDWGIVFDISPHGIECAPYGKPGETWLPTKFAVETYRDTEKLAEVTSLLSLLAAKYTYRPLQNRIEPSQLDLLEERLIGKEKIPLVVDSGYRPRTGNSLIITLLEQAANPDAEI